MPQKVVSGSTGGLRRPRKVVLGVPGRVDAPAKVVPGVLRKDRPGESGSGSTGRVNTCERGLAVPKTGCRPPKTWFMRDRVSASLCLLGTRERLPGYTPDGRVACGNRPPRPVVETVDGALRKRRPAKVFLRRWSVPWWTALETADRADPRSSASCRCGRLPIAPGVGVGSIYEYSSHGQDALFDEFLAELTERNFRHLLTLWKPGQSCRCRSGDAAARSGDGAVPERAGTDQGGDCHHLSPGTRGSGGEGLIALPSGCAERVRSIIRQLDRAQESSR